MAATYRMPCCFRVNYPLFLIPIENCYLIIFFLNYYINLIFSPFSSASFFIRGCSSSDRRRRLCPRVISRTPTILLNHVKIEDLDPDTVTFRVGAEFGAVRIQFPAIFLCQGLVGGLTVFGVNPP